MLAVFPTVKCAFAKLKLRFYLFKYFIILSLQTSRNISAQRRSNGEFGLKFFSNCPHFKLLLLFSAFLAEFNFICFERIDLETLEETQFKSLAGINILSLKRVKVWCTSPWLFPNGQNFECLKSFFQWTSRADGQQAHFSPKGVLFIPPVK